MGSRGGPKLVVLVIVVVILTPNGTLFTTENVPPALKVSSQSGEEETELNTHWGP